MTPTRARLPMAGLARRYPAVTLPLIHSMSASRWGTRSPTAPPPPPRDAHGGRATEHGGRCPMAAGNRLGRDNREDRLQLQLVAPHDGPAPQRAGLPQLRRAGRRREHGPVMPIAASNAASGPACQAVKRRSAGRRCWPQPPAASSVILLNSGDTHTWPLVLSMSSSVVAVKRLMSQPLPRASLMRELQQSLYRHVQVNGTGGSAMRPGVAEHNAPSQSEHLRELRAAFGVPL